MNAPNQHNPADLRRLAAAEIAHGKNADALPLLWQALALAPDDTQTLNDLGNLLVNVGQPEEGLALLLHALDMRPDEAKLHGNVGIALASLGRIEEAMAAQREALRLMPQLAAGHTNIANLLMIMGQPAEALQHFDHAFAIGSDSKRAAKNRAIALLALGHLQEGFRGYEHRWSSEGDPLPGVKGAKNPLRWEGQPLAGKRILVVVEQGIGDAIHFVRYISLLKARGAYVLLQCHALLTELLQTVAGIDEILPQEWIDSGATPYPPFDYHAPLMSLPHHLDTTLATIPADVPYLHASNPRRRDWAQRLNLDQNRLNVGIVWQGNPHHQWDRYRSLPLAMFVRLTQIPALQIFSLQRGPGIEQIPTFQAATGGALQVPTNGLQEKAGDLADIAAIISLLDLVITVDSAPAHCAGALACPVWILLSLAADWRWLTQRNDSPWYPTMRLFRQRALNEWSTVFENLEQDLRDLTEQPRKPP